MGNVTDNLDKEFFEVIPAVADSKGWTRLRRLRECLQMQGRLLEARAILDQELGQTPDGSEQEKACRSLLEACVSQKDSKEPIWWIIGRSKIRQGQVLTAGSQIQARNDAFQDARCALKAARASGCENNTLLSVRLAELNALHKSGHLNALQVYDAFVQCASVKNDNYIHSTALTRACKIALVHLESDHSPSKFNIFWQWYRRAESIVEQLGDIAYLLIFRLATGDIACAEKEDFGAILKWHEDFEMKHPSTHLWRQKIAVRKTNLIIYERLHDGDNVDRTNREIRYIAADQDDFWTDDVLRKQADIKLSSDNRDPDMTSTPAAFQNRDPEMAWLGKWWKEMPISMDSGRKKSVVRIASYTSEVYLCSWIKEDFQEGVLTKQDLANILNHYVKQDEPKGHARDAIKSEASNSEINMDSNLEEIVTSLTPEILSGTLFGTYNAPASESHWEKVYSTLSDWLLRKSTRAVIKRHFLLFQAQNQRLGSVVNSATPWELRALEAQRLIALFPKLDTKIQKQFSPNLAYWRRTVAAAKHMIHIKSSDDGLLDMDSPELKEVIKLYNQSLAENHDTNGPLMRDIYINMDMAQVYYNAATRLNPIAFEGLSNAAARAVQAFEKIRAGWRALTGWDRVEKLLLAMEERKILQIAPTAVTVISKVPDYNREGRDKLIWDLIQFAKSIGISWLMESNMADAREKAIEGRSDNDPSHSEAVGSQGDLEKAGDLEQNPSTWPDTSQNSDKDPTTGKREGNTKALATEADNRVENNTNAGVDTDLLQADLQNINRLGGDAVFVDWYNGACGLGETLKPKPKPIITTLSGTNEGPKYSLASITWKEVDEIVDAFMEMQTDELQDDDCVEFLYELNPLVEPLAWTKPGQTLVFSPCGNLHRIPLHALKINGEVIIKRNPVVYCSSLSALVNTYRVRMQMDLQHGSTQSTAHVLDTENPYPSSRRLDGNLKVSLFGQPPTPNGQAALEATANKFKAKAHIGEESFTASSFTSTIQGPGLQLLHYHGHADFSATAPTDHCLIFSDRDLTLRDIFDLSFPLTHGAGFHVTLLGCGTGMSKTAPTDDVIGLVPSLLYAGASSTISTLWPFSDEDAAAYSESFYEGFLEGGGEGGGAEAGIQGAEEVPPSTGDIVVNMAKANQKAILGIMRKRPELYHWAPFVLNGYWMMRSPLSK